jgi:hypothetical protein
MQLHTWVKTPMTAESGREKDRLLGWATDKYFPVEIATRQVNNGWGAYEIFNANGSISSVFIPVGSYTFIENDNTMHAIWANGPLLQRC